MAKRLFIEIFVLISIFSLNAQNERSIYEVGKKLVNCEANFENLITNWTANNITNSAEYKYIRYKYIETINDSLRYNYYRNYFSGPEVLYNSISGLNGERNGHKSRNLYVRPGYKHSELYDVRGLFGRPKEILTDSVRAKAIKLLTTDFNVDTMRLKCYDYEFIRDDTISGFNHSFYTYNINHKFSVSKIYYVDSLSTNYIDIYINKKKDASLLDLTEIRRLLIEKLLIGRIQIQMEFSSKVQFGDKVYAVRFEYLGKSYINYVICSIVTNKVVMDFFAKDIFIAKH
ncbi:MAG TPA: hypothetical protein VK152_13105 [Paludibacter sp.]|nr:hypothetical protein [Paludibacter sp.]